MWPAIIGAAGSVVTTGLNNANSQSNAAQSFQRQKELMALQQQYAVENWNRENNYNKPEEQMKRLKAAGLNPDLVYGNGASGLQSGPIAAPTAPAAPMAQTVPMANPIVEGVQAALAMSQAKKAGSETIRQDIENKYLEDSIATSLSETVSRMDLNDATRKKVLAEIPNIAKQGALIDSQINSITEQITASQWHRICEWIITDVEKELKGEQANQIRQLTPALLRANNAKAALDEAYGKIAGLAGDPEKAFDLVEDWADAVGTRVSRPIEWLLEKIGYKPDYSAHDKYVKQHGASNGKPSSWRPGLNQ